MAYSIAFDSAVIPDMEKTISDFSTIGVIKSIETVINTSVADQSKDKYTIIVHLYFWYYTKLTQILQSHFARDEMIMHESFEYLLRKSDSNTCPEIVRLRDENTRIRAECSSMIDHLGKINDNIEEIKTMISSGAYRADLDYIRNELIGFANRYKKSKKSVRFDVSLREDSSSDESDDPKVYPKETIPKRKTVCPGCIDNQPNQMAHIGPHGCLGDDI